MIVHDLNVFRPSRRPPKTDVELVVDANAVLTGAFVPERFQPVTRRDAQIVEPAGDLQLPELPSGDRFDACEPLDTTPVRKGLGIGVPNDTRPSQPANESNPHARSCAISSRGEAATTWQSLSPPGIEAHARGPNPTGDRARSLRSCR